MLPDFFKIVAKNNTTQQLDFSGNPSNETLVVTAKFWKMTNDGTVYSDEVTLFTAATDIANGGHEVGAEYDNSTNKYHGFNATARLKTDNGSVSGSVEFSLEFPTDGTEGAYPDEDAGFAPSEDCVWVDSLSIAAATTKSLNMMF